MSSSLTSKQRAEVEAKILSLGPEPGKGTEARKALFDATPDNVACIAQNPPPAAVVGTRWTSEAGAALAKCRLAAGDLDGAERAALERRTVAQRWEFYEGRVLANTDLMRVRAARGQTPQAIASLRSDMAEVESKVGKQVAFEVALALGEVELRAGRPEGRNRLVKLEQEAKSREFFRIARLAREALERKPSAAASKPAQ
jgi:hypothetical protein